MVCLNASNGRSFSSLDKLMSQLSTELCTNGNMEMLDFVTFRIQQQHFCMFHAIITKSLIGSWFNLKDAQTKCNSGGFLVRVPGLSTIATR